jgi:uncharacterized protein (DUF362 family)
MATLGVGMIGAMVAECPPNPDAVDPQESLALQPHIKAGGQTINVPNRPPQPATTVAIIKADGVNIAAMVSQAHAVAVGPGGIGNLVHSGQTVLSKPNLVTSKVEAVTDWLIVKALVDLIETVNNGANITIADGSATQDTFSVMNAQGYTTANFGSGATFADFSATGTNPTNTYVLADSRTGVAEQIPALVTDAAVYIDVPRMKTHCHAGFTGALKNLGTAAGPMPV